LFEELKSSCPTESPAARGDRLQVNIAWGAVGTIHRLRKRYAEVLREEIAHTVSALEEIDDEIRH
jgi:hypothetical protein